MPDAAKPNICGDTLVYSYIGDKLDERRSEWKCELPEGHKGSHQGDGVSWTRKP